MCKVNIIFNVNKKALSVNIMNSRKNLSPMQKKMQ